MEIKGFMRFCPHCGKICAPKFDYCPKCGTPCVETDLLAKDSMEMTIDQSDAWEAKLLEEQIRPNPLFDEEAYQKQKAERDAFIYSGTQSSSQQYTPRCPTCGSPNIRQIGNERLAEAWRGVYSPYFGKTFSCSNCGYIW